MLESARSAKRAVQDDPTERERRMREGRKELDKLITLYKRVQALGGPAMELTA